MRRNFLNEPDQVWPWGLLVNLLVAEKNTVNGGFFFVFVFVCVCVCVIFFWFWIDCDNASNRSVFSLIPNMTQNNQNKIGTTIK